MFLLIIANLVSWRVRHYETFGHFRLMSAWYYRMWEELFSSLLSFLLKVTEHVSLTAKIVYISCLHGYSNWLEFLLCIFTGSLFLSLNSTASHSLLTATSSARLEDLGYLDSQRATGHRGSVRKHNTSGRTSDDSKGIFWASTTACSM